jgi:hypothetical protein
MLTFKCTCDPAVLDNELARYAAQVLLELPDCRERSRRIAGEMSTQVCIDPCIVEVIKCLWANGIETLGCCCGHNKLPAYVDVHPDHWATMDQLSYKKMPVNQYGHGEWSFYL